MYVGAIGKMSWLNEGEGQSGRYAGVFGGLTEGRTEGTEGTEEEDGRRRG